VTTPARALLTSETILPTITGVISRATRVASIVTILVSGAAVAQQPPAGNINGGGHPGGVGVVVGKIGIGLIGPPTLRPDLRIKLEDALAAGLKASGTDVVSAADLSRARAAGAFGACTDLVCEQRLAQITGTNYWLRGTCQLDTSTYRLHLELVDSRSGVVMTSRDDTCDICTEADAADLANVAASALKTTLAHAQLAPAAGGSQPGLNPGGSAETGGIQAAGQRDGDAGTTDRGPSAWRRVLGWGAVGGGIAAAAVGGFYYLPKNGNETGCELLAGQQRCFRLFDTTWQTVGWIGAGVVVAAAGVVLLRIPTRSASIVAPESAARTAGLTKSSPEVVISLGSVGIAGHF
jgi:hypothetical protein